jgi:PASTA domain-containing protein
MELIQQDPAGNPCAVTRSAELTLDATNDIHHRLVNYQIPAPVFATCGGSRTFKVRLMLDWVSGNPLKIDSGTATRANVIVRQTRPTTTVPDAVGIDETTAAARVQGAGLTIGLINSVVDPAPVGSVIAQNSPAGTVEPTASAVDLTVSLGSVTVPDVEDDTQTAAVQALSGAGLTPTVALQQGVHQPGPCDQSRAGCRHPCPSRSRHPCPSRSRHPDHRRHRQPPDLYQQVSHQRGRK